jgi:two-component system, cell cycle sensor histidine kinase and response regulator CckA
MTGTDPTDPLGLARRLAEAEATIAALLSGEIDAVVDPMTKTPLLISKAQEALLDSEERYRRIVETSEEGICTLDLDAHFTFVNRRVGELLGHPPHEMVGRSLYDFIDKTQRSEIRFERNLAGGSEDSEVEIRRTDGVTIWLLIKNTPILDKRGTTVGMLAMLTDRTSHRHADEALRKSELQYRQIVETTTDGIVKVDVDARFVFVNQRFADMLGYLPEEMIGRPIFSFMNAQSKVLAKAGLESRRKGSRVALDLTYVHKSGTEVMVNVAGTAFLDAVGNYAGTLGMVRDVTEQKKLQEQLMVSDRMASVGTLAAGVAHEINNPLSAVLANLEIMDESLDQMLASDPATSVQRRTDAWLLDEVKAPLADAREAADRVRFIVRDLKIFSRSPKEEVKTVVDVQETMESALRMAWNEIRHRARLVKRYSPVPGVDANQARLGQVFLNLVVNAAQALEDGRAEQNEICVGTALEGDRVVIEVCDTGAGIPPEVVGRIFDPFFTTKEVGVGTGLGLAICMRIVTDMGGELTVTSEVGKGTRFRIALPVGSGVKVAEMGLATSAPAGRPRGQVMLIDDDELVVKSVKRLLVGEHDVVTAVSGQAALALLASGVRFDVILCDLMMPDMTGMNLHRELARIAPEQAARMVFATGGAFTATARDFLAATQNDQLEKPFELASLREMVRRYVPA